MGKLYSFYLIWQGKVRGKIATMHERWNAGLHIQVKGFTSYKL